MDYLNSGTEPARWGIVKMMDRIRSIQDRFNSMLPVPRVSQPDFKSQLKQSLQNAAPKAPADAPLESWRNPYETYDELLKTERAPGNMPEAFDELISGAAGRHGLDTRLLRSVVKAESNFNPRAVSPKGAMGLMQLMPETAKRYGVSDPFDPAENLDAGAKHLKELLVKYGGDVRLALAAYNSGAKAVETYKGIPPYDETRDYVSRVVGMLERPE
ncbi:MAG: lytic transglycosylase domain-containing protein [bacterium]